MTVRANGINLLSAQNKKNADQGKICQLTINVKGARLILNIMWKLQNESVSQAACP